MTTSTQPALTGPTISRITSEIQGIATDSYRRGWNDALEAIRKATTQVAKLNGAAGHDEDEDELDSAQSDSATQAVALEPKTMMYFMFEFIRKNPGQTGSKVISGTVALAAKSDVGLNPRSGRTSLGRLHRDKQLIVKRGDGWYAKE